MTPEETIAFQEVWQTLEYYGLLLEADTQLPSLASIVAGEPVHGSWWGHPQGHTIYHVANELSEHTDIIVVKLIAGKLTYIHRILWSALLGIATEQAPWQLHGLSDTAQILFSRITKDHVLRTDHLRKFDSFNAKALREAIQTLERKLLIYSESSHTETGAHTKILETWSEWSTRIGFTEQPAKPAQGKKIFEDILAKLNSHYGTQAQLPWMASSYA